MRRQATGYGLRATDYGLRTTDYGLRATGYGLPATGYALRYWTSFPTTEESRPKTENGPDATHRVVQVTVAMPLTRSPTDRRLQSARAWPSALIRRI
jgi:hypothetical protein